MRGFFMSYNMDNNEFIIQFRQDWDRVERNIRKKFSTIPEFKKDVSTLCNNISKLMSKASQAEVMYRQTKKQKYLDEIDQYVKDSNSYILRFTKIWMFSILSR